VTLNLSCAQLQEIEQKMFANFEYEINQSRIRPQNEIKANGVYIPKSNIIKKDIIFCYTNNNLPVAKKFSLDKTLMNVFLLNEFQCLVLEEVIENKFHKEIKLDVSSSFNFFDVSSWFNSYDTSLDEKKTIIKNECDSFEKIEADLMINGISGTCYPMLRKAIIDALPEIYPEIYGLCKPEEFANY